MQNNTIEYQLYQSPKMTQILIPKPIYPSHLEHQNLFQPSIGPEVRAKRPIYTRKLNSKKSGGAFKLFKHKRTRKIETAENISEGSELRDSPVLKKTYKLVSRPLRKTNALDNTFFSESLEAPFGYYDPNLAPLHCCEGQESRSLGCGRGVDCQKIDIFPLASKQKIIVQKKMEKIIEIAQSQSEKQVKYQYKEMQGQKDDPFIIVKKVDVKRAKLKKMLGSIAGLPKISKEMAKNELKLQYSSPKVRLTEVKMREIDTPSIKDKDSCLLAETEKSQHSKQQELMMELQGEGNLSEYECRKRWRCGLSYGQKCNQSSLFCLPGEGSLLSMMSRKIGSLQIIK